MRRTALVLALLFAAGCGPACPTAREWRADLLPDRVAGGQKIELSANVIGQMNQLPPILLARLSGTPPRPLKVVVLNADGTAALTVDAAPERDGLYRLELALPGREPLPAGVYRLRAELPEPVEASFEVRKCVVYY